MVRGTDGKVNVSSDTLHFNKEIVLGETGSLVMAPVSGKIASLFTNNPDIISFVAVIGSLLGASCLWLFFRIKHQKQKGIHSNKKLMGDIFYFTPVASTIVFVIYQPILYFLSNYLLRKGIMVILAVISAQLTAFLTFLILINIYRVILERTLGRKL